MSRVVLKKIYYEKNPNYIKETFTFTLTHFFFFFFMFSLLEKLDILQKHEGGTSSNLENRRRACTKF